jgi:hypothetical protein
VEETRRSILSRIIFPAFAWGLVFHSLAIAVLFGALGVSENVARAIAAWKEIGLFLLILVVIIRSVTGRGPKNVITWPDVWIGALVTTAVLFLLTENLWLRFNLPASAELLGIRDAVYFMLAYFVGRATPELASDERTMRMLFVLVLVTCIIGVAERLLVTPEMLVAIGVAAYYQDFLGVAAFTLGNDYGLPLNYWAGIGGHLFRRAGSVYLSGQGFAIPFLLFFPLATAWTFVRARRSAAQITGYAIICVALLFTLTRMTIIVALIQLILFVSLRKRPEWAVAGLATGFMIFTAACILIPGFPAFIWNTLSFQESSSASHVNDLQNGLAAFAQHPWGMGLGTTDQTAVRAGLNPVTGDNMYLKYAVEMGVAGIVLLVATLAAIGSSAMKLYRRGTTLPEQRMGMTLWLATIGVAINGLTAVPFNSITLGWLFFWLAGAAVTVADNLAAEAPVWAPIVKPLTLDVVK